MNIHDLDPHLIEPQRLAGSVLDAITIERKQPGYTGRAITAREALLALTYEANFVAMCALRVHRGVAPCGCTILAASDIDRLLIAKSSIDAITAEAVR